MPLFETQWKNKVRRTLDIEARAVLLQKKNLDDSFFLAAKKILACKGRLVVMGVGKSGLIGRKLSATFSSTGTPSFFVHPAEGLHGDLGMVKKGDITLLLSFSGETDELKGAIQYLKAASVPIVALTGSAKSRLGQASDIVISVVIKKEACPFNAAPTSSTTAMLALGDALALLVMEMRGFSDKDFAKLHPAGMLGKKLNMTVSDIMHKGKENPVVKEDRVVKDALLVMTRTRMGAASVVDARGRLVGVFTDGDLRRHLQSDGALLSKRLAEVMTKSPKTLSPQARVKDILPLFRRLRLDNFPVVDKANKPVGLLDEKDLLEQGFLF